MQIIKKTKGMALKLARKLGTKKVIGLLNSKNITGRGGAGFPTAKKWQFAVNTISDKKYVICNADEGEPGTFKDKFIIEHNPETLIEGILIACETIKADTAFIYLRGEYEYLKDGLKKNIDNLIDLSKSKVDINIIVGAGAYVCGDETAIIRSIEGYSGRPYYKPPFPPVAGLWGKPTVINNVETLVNVAQAITLDNYDPDLRLMSVSGNVSKPGIYELPIGTNLKDICKLANPIGREKAVFFGCFGGCMPVCDIELTPQNVRSEYSNVGAFTIIITDDNQSVPKLTENIARFYEHESCGKCTPCREGTKRILDIISKINKGKGTMEDLETLEDLGEHIHKTALCGLGQTATNHLLTALKHFRNEFEALIR